MSSSTPDKNVAGKSGHQVILPRQASSAVLGIVMDAFLHKRTASVLLFGEHGSGKTFLMNEVANYLKSIRRTITVVRVSLTQYARNQRQLESPLPSASRSYRDCLLLLDDFEPSVREESRAPVEILVREIIALLDTSSMKRKRGLAVIVATRDPATIKSQWPDLFARFQNPVRIPPPSRMETIMQLAAYGVREPDKVDKYLLSNLQGDLVSTGDLAGACSEMDGLLQQLGPKEIALQLAARLGRTITGADLERLENNNAESIASSRRLVSIWSDEEPRIEETFRSQVPRVDPMQQRIRILLHKKESPPPSPGPTSGAAVIDFLRRKGFDVRLVGGSKYLARLGDKSVTVPRWELTAQAATYILRQAGIDASSISDYLSDRHKDRDVSKDTNLRKPERLR